MNDGNDFPVLEVGVCCVLARNHFYNSHTDVNFTVWQSQFKDDSSFFLLPFVEPCFALEGIEYHGR